VFARFEKIARASVAKGVTDGLFDMRRDLTAGREGALDQVPREIRSRVRSAINTTLASAGVTRETVQRNTRELAMLQSVIGTVRLIKRAG
jgi:hypothetical protein